ncbi:hypothetical protein ACOL3H_06990 [Aliarcobacter butzleri]
MNYLYQDKIGKPIKLKGITIPYELLKDILNTNSKFIVICPYDKNFLQYVTDEQYYKKFGVPDTDCCVDYFIEHLCNQYIKKHKKIEFKRNKSKWRTILNEVVLIHKKIN